MSNDNLMNGQIVALLARKSNEMPGVVESEKSVAHQIAEGRACAARHGGVVDDRYIFIDDGVSGAEFVKRPGLIRLLGLLTPRAPFQWLIMSEESRLGREQIETNYILKRIIDAAVRVLSYLEDREITLDTPIDKMMAGLQHFAAEMERERARQRTYSAMASKARAGHVTGGRVFGFDNVDVFAPEPNAEGRPKRLYVRRRINEAQAAVIRRIFTLTAEGFGLTRIAKALNEDGLAPPRPGGAGWAPTAVREILHRDLYRGVNVWNRTQKIMRGGTRKQRRRPPAEWLRLPAEELRIVSDALWEAAHMRLARTRNAFRPTPGRTPGRLDLALPYLLSGLGRCTICGGSLIAMSRHHGRRRGFFYGCAYNAKRGPRICTNNLHMPQMTLENTVIAAVARQFDEATVAAAVDRAFELFGEERQNARERRTTIEEALRAVRSDEARLVDAVKHAEHIETLVAALHSAQERRRALETQLASAGAAVENFDAEALRTKLLKRAADVRGVLARRQESETRRVLQAVFAERIQFAPFNEGATRGYQFVGNGSYGQLLLGDTCPTSERGPKGIRALLNAAVRGIILCAA